MDMLGLSPADVPGLGLNAAALLLLYRINLNLYRLHRDIGEVATRLDVEVKSLKSQLGHQWGWIQKVRRHLWPQVFEGRQACD